MAESQQLLLSYVLPNGNTDSIYLDAAVNEQHVTSAEVTSHPVEPSATGSINVTDYIRPMPKRISITGLITNTPLATPKSQSRGAVGNVQSFSQQVAFGPQAAAPSVTVNWKALQFNAEMDRVRDVYGALVNAALQGALFTVTTTLATYENMAIINFAVPRDVEHSNAMQFTIDLQQIRIVSTQTVQALPGKVQPQHRGSKPAQQLDATKDQQKISTLKSIVNSVFGGH